MSNTDPAIIIILSEIVLIETTLLIVIVFFSILKRRKRSKILTNILAEFSEEKNSRKLYLKNIYKIIPGASVDKIDETVDAIIDEEMAFYQYITAVLHNNKLSDIEGLNQSVIRLVKPYEMLASEISSPEANIVKDTSVNASNVDSAIDELLQDNESDDEIDADPSLDLSNTSKVEEIPKELLEGDDK